MSRTNSQAAKAQSFKSKYKLQGLIASVVVMWLDYVLIYQGLIAGDLGLVGGGMIVMFAAVAVAYYFG
jgi:hypothetical protein